jgi:hypothetical protein
LEVGDGGQAAEGVVVQGVVGPGATLLTLQQAGIQQLLEVVADRRLAQAQGAGELAHTDRVGAGRQQVDDPDPVGVSQGLNSRAVASAWSSDRLGAPSGVQQAAGTSASLADVVVVVMGVPYIERCRCDHAIMHRHLSM